MSLSGKARGLVAVLGWGLEEFESACRESAREVLVETRDFLAGPDDPPSDDEAGDADVKARAAYGVRFIDGLLEGRPMREL